MRRIVRLGRTIAAVFGVGGVVAASAFATAGTASAATLYTTPAHTTLVPVGTTAIATLESPDIVFNGPITNSSTGSTVSLSLTQNSGGVVGANVIGGTFTGGAPLSGMPNFNPPWQVVVSGSSSTSGSALVWPASVNNVSFTFGGLPVTGNLTSGVLAAEPSAAGAPVSLWLDNAGTLSNPLLGSGTVTGQYVLAGPAANFSLGNP